METMAAPFPPPLGPPASSRLPHSQSQSPRAPQKATTRPVVVQQEQHHHPPLSAPASQESIASSSRVPDLHASDSNLSASTDLTSPSSSAGADLLHHHHPPCRARNTTPENGQQTPPRAADNALYSPMSIASPVATNGAKRTASGHVKTSHSIHTSPYRLPFPGRDSRRDSLSSAGSKAGEIAATLKARLGYAMAKVQNGWEHKSLAEVEQLVTQRQRSRSNASHMDQQQQQQQHHHHHHHHHHHRPSTSGLSNGASRLSMDDHYPSPPHPPPSKRTSGNYSHYQAQLQHQQQSASHRGSAPRLQPAPDIRPTSSQQARVFPAPSLQPLAQQRSNAMSPPRTPISNASPRRPTTIRTQTQTAEAERDALQALFQLGSPHTSLGPHIPRTGTATTCSSQSHLSPARTDVPPRLATWARSESASTSSSAADTDFQALHDSRTRLIGQLADQ